MREPSDVGRRRRRWDRISWWYSLVLLVPILAFIVTAAWPSSAGPLGVSGVVKDAYTGEPVPDAVVSTANATATTNGDGRFTVPDLTATSLSVTRHDYESTQVAIGTGDERLEVALRPTSVKGVVKNKRTGKPVSGATVVAAVAGGETLSTTTNEDGEYLLQNVPPDAVISVIYEGSTLASRPVDRDVEIDFEVRPDALTGRVTDTAGNPLPGAKVIVGSVTALTADDGTYRVVGVPEEGSITVRKAGYVDITAEIPESLKFDATLEGSQVRAIYATAQTVGNDDAWDRLLEIADTTDVNAIVVDLKDESGHVYYDSQVALAGDIGAEMPLFDLQGRLTEMKDHDLYAIARIVVFEDPLLAEARPDLAVIDASTGELWRTWDGRAWVNPHHRDVWQYHAELAVEAAAVGFDEVQLDAVRFPSDGILDSAHYGDAYVNESKTDAVAGFLGHVRGALSTTHAYLAVSTLGLTVWAEDDANLGEDFSVIMPLVDIISPKLFPTHFYPGELGFDIPGNHPHDVVLRSLEYGETRAPEAASKMRPWIQDFSYGEGIEYGSAEVAAQIQAVNEFGGSGWMVWSPNSEYSTSAFGGD